jgi:hypothetical protein
MPWKRNCRSASFRGAASKGASRSNNASRTEACVRGSPPSAAATQQSVAGASLRQTK